MTFHHFIKPDDLGARIADYTRNRNRQIGSFAGSTILIMIGGFSIIAAYWEGLIPLAVGLLYFLPGLWWLIHTLRIRDLSVRVFSDGLVYIKSGKTQTVRWEKIAVVQQMSRTTTSSLGINSTVHACTVHLQDGSKHVFNSALGSVEQLALTIHQEASRRILPRVRAAYDAGQSVSFGPLRISREGIAKGRKTLPWSRVKDIEIEAGFVNVYVEPDTILRLIATDGKGHKWASIAVAKMPNVFVLKNIADEILLGDECDGEHDGDEIDERTGQAAKQSV